MFLFCFLNVTFISTLVCSLGTHAGHTVLALHDLSVFQWTWRQSSYRKLRLNWSIYIKKNDVAPWSKALQITFCPATWPQVNIFRVSLNKSIYSNSESNNYGGAFRLSFLWNWDYVTKLCMKEIYKKEIWKKNTKTLALSVRNYLTIYHKYHVISNLSKRSQCLYVQGLSTPRLA